MPRCFLQKAGNSRVLTDFHSCHSCFQRLLEKGRQSKRGEAAGGTKEEKDLQCQHHFKEQQHPSHLLQNKENTTLCSLPAALLISLTNLTVLPKVLLDGQMVWTLRTCTRAELSVLSITEDLLVLEDMILIFHQT